MKKAHVVIGMNYGDEGKGHITNYFSDAQTLNVRFNGGAQAAHAVTLSNGLEHVFHHFGAGSLRGGRTLLARKFIVNPIVFMKELKELLDKTTMRETFIDPRCMVTTFYDILMNLYSLKQRNAKDSVGVGINETVERNQYDEISLNVRQLKEFTTDHLIKKIRQIENEWLPFRLNQLDFDEADFRRFGTDYMTADIETRFVEFSKWLIDHSVVWNDSDLIDKYLAKEEERSVVFEGAQGMLLDQRRKEYHPFLTRSNTGIKNVDYIMRDMKTEVDLTVMLTTRAYLTRHGDGPIFNEITTGMDFDDMTNPENDSQGAMRYGTLNYEWYLKALAETDTYMYENNMNGKVGVAVTCLDQLPDDYEGGNTKVQLSVGSTQTLTSVGAFKNIRLMSHGKTEKDIDVVFYE